MNERHRGDRQRDIERGRKFWDSFSSEAMRSNVLPEFSAAMSQWEERAGTTEADTIAEARELLGVECRTEHEANYVLERARVISDLKRIASGKFGPEFGPLFIENAEESVGMMISFTWAIDQMDQLGLAAKLNRLFGRRVDPRSRVLNELLESGATRHDLRAKIRSLASGRRPHPHVV